VQKERRGMSRGPGLGAGWSIKQQHHPLLLALTGSVATSAFPTAWEGPGGRVSRKTAAPF
jgi:hypothetical protein